MTATLDNLPITQVEIHHEASGEPSTNVQKNNGHTEEISIGSAGSLVRRQNMWDDELLSGKFILKYSLPVINFGKDMKSVTIFLKTV